MSIIGTDRLMNELEHKDDVHNLEWTKAKDIRLAKYVEEYSNAVIDVTQFYQKIDWTYLSRILEFPDIDFLKLKVDELYDQRYDYFHNNEFDIRQVTSDWKDKKNPLYKEVAGIISSLDLESFKLEISPPIPDNQVEKVNKNTKPVVVVNNSIDLKVRSEMPKMTKTQRRMSLDLMHPGPNSLLHTFEGNNRDSNLIKPAVISTTYVNAVTKAEIGVKETGIQHPLINNRLRNVSKKLGFGFSGQNGKPSRTSSAPKVIIDQPSNDDVDKQNRIKQTLPNDKKLRRGSLFGENLPMYIKNQLRKEVEEESVPVPIVIPPEPKKNEIKAKRVNSPIIKVPSRVQNLLANSQSLYAHSRDISSIKFPNGSQTHTNESENTDRHYDSDVDDNDREYISPDSITKNYNDDQDEIFRGIEGEDDPLVKLVLSFDNLSGLRDDAMSAHSSEEEDDDYLLKV
ncbi:hypothetical protein DFJ63DRAFT_334305 [Scheffersomyces coipomensis]|uniref:uncharacterized protein n=1 Tax=Scheffersomyces coipomensis TaxID=1788519 RepID=UPI00315D5B7F